MYKNLVQFFTEKSTPGSAGIALAASSKMSIGKMLPVRQFNDIVFTYGKETSVGEVKRRALNQNFPDANGGTTSPVSEQISIIGRPTEIDTMIDQADPMSRPNEHARAGRAIGMDVDWQLFNGDRSQDATTINGLSARCTGSQKIVADTNGGALTMDHVHDLIDSVEDVGAGKDVFWHKDLQRQFKSLVIATASGASLADVSSEVLTYEGVRFHAVGRGLNGKSLLDFNETTGTSNVTASAYCVAPGPVDVELAGVRLLLATNSVQIIENGKVGAMVVDTIQFAFGLAVFDNLSAARLSGLLAP